MTYEEIYKKCRKQTDRINKILFVAWIIYLVYMFGVGDIEKSHKIFAIITSFVVTFIGLGIMLELEESSKYGSEHLFYLALKNDPNFRKQIEDFYFETRHISDEEIYLNYIGTKWTYLRYYREFLENGYKRRWNSFMITCLVLNVILISASVFYCKIWPII